MKHAVIEESFCSLIAHYRNRRSDLVWGPLFSQPAWLQVWWRAFCPDSQLQILSVYQNGSLLGIAPLQTRGSEASFIGSADVSDYTDFMAAPGRSQEFFSGLLDHLQSRGVTALELAHVRPESLAFTDLLQLAQRCGYATNSAAEEVSVELALPATFDDYLGELSKKQRHEVRRKLRRLSEAGDVQYYTLRESASLSENMDTFLQMFRESRTDKEDYLNDQRESFFRNIAKTMADWGLLRMGVLELDGQVVAMLLYFDYQGRIYLYNSGYDPDFRPLSVGLISKVLCIKDSIAQGGQVFDFLKGDEVYKYRLGGVEVPLHRCRIDMA